MTEYVRRHAELYPYLPTIEAEQEDARDAWMRMQPSKGRLRAAKERLAALQGGYYALLELGFQPAADIIKPDDQARAVAQLAQLVAQQRGTWQEEEARTSALTLALALTLTLTLTLALALALALALTLALTLTLP
jgi:hypothetical protein